MNVSEYMSIIARIINRMKNIYGPFNLMTIDHTYSADLVSLLGTPDSYLAYRYPGNLRYHQNTCFYYTRENTRMAMPSNYQI